MAQIILLVCLILLNAFFAASEMAFVSLNDTKISVKAKEGDKKYKKIEKMLKSPSKFLATIQIGITLAGFLSSAFASDVFASKLSVMLYNSTHLFSVGIWSSISIVIITIILSYFTLIFGELVPKRIAMENAEKFSKFSISIITALAKVMSPFVKFLTWSTDCVSKLFGVSKENEETVTEEEIRMMVDVGQEKGTINNDEKEMINNVFELNDKDVSEIMVHRTEMFALDKELTVSEVSKKLVEGDFRYSRIPVYDEDIDNIEGVLYIKELLRANSNTKIKKLLKDTLFVPKTKRIDELFKEMQKSKIQIAIVVDEYGGTTGMVTMEDVLEEIVGDIYDEYDPIENEYEKIDENTYIVDGQMSILDFEKLLQVKNIETEYDTVSGYLMELLDRIPTEEENIVIETKGLVFKPEEFDDRRIAKVKVCKIMNENEEADESVEE
ncbi:MAG: HlyC/CorC family transporter [Clostridia bacterium]|jgi:putative hemolysin|nr:HlyC/CorC family transporter [Clostridia bacterium]